MARGKLQKGVGWVVCFLVRQGLSLVSVSVLAHLVPPSAYGLVAMAVLLANFFDSFRDLGTGNALIREPELTDRFVSTLFWANAVIGVAFSAAIYGLSFP